MKFLQVHDQLFIRADAITHVIFRAINNEDEPLRERALIYFTAQGDTSEGGKGGGQKYIHFDEPEMVDRIKKYLVRESKVL